MEQCLLVDGHNLLFQMFFGMPSRIYGKNKIPIHGVIGFMGALIKTINAIKATKVLVLFDNENGSFRNTVNQDYKANRVDYSQIDENENPFSQFDHICLALDAVGIKNLVVEAGYEADDVIASYCLNCSETTNIFIMSFDSDFFQLINDHVFVYRYRGVKSTIYDTTKVFEAYHVAPSQIVDYKSLVGDATDNIKGVDKIGKITGQKLLNTYNNLNGIIRNIEKITPSHIQKSILDHLPLLRQNQDIIRLNNHVPLPFPIDQLAFNPDKKELKTMNILRSIDLID